MSDKPSPYVSIHISRKQAEAVRRAVVWFVTGRAESNPLWAALKRIDEALAKNAGDTA